MNLYMYYGIFFLILLIGLVVTLVIGFSNQNKVENQAYFQRTGTKWVRLASFYVVSIVLGLLALLFYIKYF